MTALQAQRIVSGETAELFNPQGVMSEARVTVLLAKAFHSVTEFPYGR